MTIINTYYDTLPVLVQRALQEHNLRLAVDHGAARLIQRRGLPGVPGQRGYLCPAKDLARVTPERIAEVARELRAKCEAKALAQSPLLASVPTPEEIEASRQRMLEASRAYEHLLRNREDVRDYRLALYAAEDAKNAAEEQYRILRARKNGVGVVKR